MAELFRYAAFISYASEDAAFAARLHRTLESYTIPKSLGEFDLSGLGKKNRIYEVFRDREGLAARNLNEQLEEALVKSANLIVVCSPNSVASPWVQKEIDFFVKLGRRDRIFAIIPDTAPLTDESGNDATTQCLPPLIRGDGEGLAQLAADARKGRDGFRNAWLKVVAAMVGKSPGDLVNRDKQRRLQQQRAIVAASVVALISGATLAAALEIRQWRLLLGAYVAETVAEDPLDQAAIALASAPGSTDIVQLRPSQTKAALERTGLASPVLLELGSVERFEFSPDGGFLLSRRSNGDEATLVDLSTLALTSLGPIGQSRFGRHSPLLVTSSLEPSALVVHRLNEARREQYAHEGMGLTTFQAFDLSPDDRFLLSYRRVRDLTGAVPDQEIEIISAFDATFGGYQFSPSGRYLLTQSAYADVVSLRDLRAGASAVPVTGHPNFESFAFSQDERFLLFDRNRFDLTSGELTSGVPVEGSGVERSVPRCDQRWIEARGDVRVCTSTDGLYTLRLDQDGSLFLQAQDGANSRFVRREVDEAGFLAGAHALWTRDAYGENAIFRTVDLSPLPNNLMSSPDGRFWLRPLPLAPSTGIESYVVHLGAWSDMTTPLLELPRPETTAFSSDGRFLMTAARYQGDAFLYDLSAFRAVPLGGLAQSIDGSEAPFSPDGVHFLTMARSGGATLRRLSLIPEPLTRSKICAASGDAIRPISANARSNADVAGILEGRPWNPCDWRGLLAIVPSNERGDDWFEGLRQWLRLMHVRYFDGDDYACEEATSRASVETLRRRADMCERFANRQASSAPN